MSAAKRNKGKIKDFISSSEEFKELKSMKKFSFREFMNGRVFSRAIISNQLTFLLFLAFLAFLYIGNHYKVEELLKRVATINKEMKELRIEAITTASDLMFMSKQSEVLKKVNESGVGLEELTVPPHKLVVRK